MKHFILVLFSLTLIFSSCKKEGCTDRSAENYDEKARKDDGSCIHPDTVLPELPSSYSIKFPGEYAGLFFSRKLVYTEKETGWDDVVTKEGFAYFSTDGGATYVNADSVKLEGYLLTKASNNSYSLPIGSANAVAQGAGMQWYAKGAAWPGFNGTTNKAFPIVGRIRSGDIPASNSYELTIDDQLNCDSLLFALHGPEKSVSYMVAANTHTFVFSYEDVISVGLGKGYTQVTGVTYELQTLNGKAHWFINQTERVKPVLFY